MPSLLFEPRIQIIDQNGEPVAGGKIYTYAAGTSTPKATYDDYALTIINPNPIILGDDGRPTSNINIFLDGAYKINITDANDISIPGYPVDNILSLSDFDFSGLTASIADLNSTTTTAIFKTFNYAVQLTDRGKNILVDSVADDVEIELLPVVTAQNGYKLTIKKIDVSTNEVEVVPNGSELIEGASKYVLYDLDDFVEILCDGSSWRVVASQIRGTIVTITAAPASPLNIEDNGKTFNCDASGGAFNINMPSAVTMGRGSVLSFKKVDSSSNSVTIEADGSESIDGLGEVSLSGHNQFFGLKSDGSNWFILNEAPGTVGSVTGDVKHSVQPSLTGWIRIDNDGTIGNAASGSNIRANADTQNLFVIIWNNISNQWCPTYNSAGSPVSRGASAIADFNANRRIAVPRLASRVIGGAGQGTGLSNHLNGRYLGVENATLTTAQLPAHTHSYQRLELADRGESGTGDFRVSGPTAFSSGPVGLGQSHTNIQPTTYLHTHMKL